jgi:hypothetical protein
MWISSIKIELKSYMHWNDYNIIMIKYYAHNCERPLQGKLYTSEERDWGRL